MESGEVLSLFISFLLFTVVDVAALSYDMLAFKL